MRSGAHETKAGLLGPAREFVGEKQVCKLALAVCTPSPIAALALQVVEPNPPHAVHRAAHIDDASTRRRTEDVKQAPGEGEMAEVIRTELHLKSVFCPAIGEGHDARVVTQRIEPAVAPSERFGEGAYGSKAREIKFQGLAGGGRRAGSDLRKCCRRLGRVATGDHHVSAFASEFAGGLEPEATVAARHHEDLAGEIGKIGGRPMHAFAHLNPSGHKGPEPKKP